ncbi:hypothetical protein GF345_02750 [Candidatus Woesearchaeota archaeon]|nr:hypothetical protein [Candidatus Woesearchaeota archaeon]
MHNKKKLAKEIAYGAAAELSLYFLIVYIEYLFSVPVNYWLSALIITILLNIAVGGCPFVRKCYHKGMF